MKFPSESCQSGTVLLGLGILIPPAASGAGWLFPNQRNQASRNPIWLQLIQLAALGSAKMYMNGELNVNKLDSPCQPHSALLDGYQGRVTADAQPDKLLRMYRWLGGLPGCRWRSGVGSPQYSNGMPLQEKALIRRIRRRARAARSSVVNRDRGRLCRAARAARARVAGHDRFHH